MFVELLMKKNGKLLFAVFLFIFIIMIGFGVSFVVNNLNTTTETFIKDGYALYIGNEKNTKAETYSFTKGTSYREKASNKSVVFESTDGNAKVNNETIIHYADRSIGVLKKVVGLDLNTIDKNIIVYYNIYNKTNITSNNDGYNIKLANNDSVHFKNLLIRVSDNKFMLTGKNIRLVLTNEEIVDFGDYVEFEYYNGNVVKIYSNEKYYQTISSDAAILVDDIKIDLKSATVYKTNKRYISLTNLVINNDSNIDTLEEETKKLEINDSTVDTSNSGGGTAGGAASGGGNIDVNEETEDSDVQEEEEEKEHKKDPIFKVTELFLTALKIDARIEIIDDFSLISSDIEVRIIENSTSKKVYEEVATMGDTQILVSCADLSPDVEYTLQAKASYKKDEVEYEKTFVSKIFRTEDLGVSFEKSYASENQIVLSITKELYSKVSQVKMEIYTETGELVNYNLVSFKTDSIQEIKFSGLNQDTKYMVKMTDIVCEGVTVERGYSISKSIETLKRKPILGNLSYEVDKKKSKFVLHATPSTDQDYGIKSYIFEVYDARKELETSAPVLSIKENSLADVSVKIDDDKILRGVPYTYRLVAEFYDNEKTIEFSKDLGQQMVLDGVEFPTVRFDEASAHITWEQINGTIIVDDPSNAIVSDQYQVIYKNSIDVYVSTVITADTSTGNIPININGLRANETYTFQIYGNVNMQDGNETAESVYIGSVFVQTKEPKPLQAAYANDKNDLSKAFAIAFMLKNPENVDSSFEASTLSQLKFTLYKGSTTDGAQEVYKRVIDSNDEPYISTLKHDYYDNSITIDPIFFGRKNSDFLEDFYTLEVTESYDYTKYKNEIPIINEKYTFKLNAYIPELPESCDDAVTISTITNNSAEAFGLEHNDKLDGNITIGYYLMPKFINEEKSAKTITWHVWMYNHTTNEYEELTELKRTQEFDEDGTLDPILFLLENGTSNEIVDTDTLRRGNEYYFSFDVMLDIDKDGEIDTEFPKVIDSDLILRSKILTPLKQESNIKLYPSISNQTSIKYKYIIEDVDNALEENKLYSYVDGSARATSSPEVLVNEEEYNELTFTGLSQGKIFSIRKKEKSLKKNNVSDIILQQQMYNSSPSSINLEYDVQVDVNKLIISIKDYMNKQDLINRIAAVNVIISPVNEIDYEKLGEKQIVGLELVNENIYVDFFQIYEYLSMDINVRLEAFFDNGILGFDLESEYVAVERVSIDSNQIYYSYDDGKKKFVQNSTITNSIFKYSFNPSENKLKLTTTSNKNSNLNIEIDNSGVNFDNNIIVLKELTKQTLTSDSNNVRFDLIIPGISMLNSANKIDIVSLLDSAEMNAKIITLDSVKILNNKIYIELYETDENGTNAKYIRTVEEQLNIFFGPAKITDLSPETNYYIQLYANVYNNATEKYEKKYLYDIDQASVGCKYNFYTLSKIHIENVIASVTEKSYIEKTLTISYNVDSVYGYDRIEYTLEKYVDETWVPLNINIPPSRTFFPNMSISIDIGESKDNNINYGEQYRITIKPIGYYNKNGEMIEMDLGTVMQEFKIDNSQLPYIGITSAKSAMSVYYRVSISDPDFIIENGEYAIQFKDKDGNALEMSSNYSINVVNKHFEFTNQMYNLVEGDEYTLDVIVKVDRNNDGKTFDTIVKSKKMLFGDKPSPGIITTVKNEKNPTSIDLVFSNSYRLTALDTIQYTISSTTNDFTYSHKEKFVTTYDKEKNLYYYTIAVGNNEEFLTDNMYIIGMNFYSENKLIAQEEVNYYYKN